MKKQTILHIIYWLGVICYCWAAASCGKEHIATRIPNGTLMQPKDGNVGKFPLPWKVVGVYDSRKDFYMYNLTSAKGDTVRCIDRDLERWLAR